MALHVNLYSAGGSRPSSAGSGHFIEMRDDEEKLDDAQLDQVMDLFGVSTKTLASDAQKDKAAQDAVAEVGAAGAASRSAALHARPRKVIRIMKLKSKCKSHHRVC